MTDTALQLALREWRAEFTKPATVPVLICVGILLTIMAPFDTDTLLRTLPRFAYWLVLASLTYSIGVMVSALVRRATPRLTHWPRLASTAIAIGASVSVAVISLNFAIFGYWPSPQILLISIGNITAIAIVITYLLSLAEKPATTAKPPPLLDRLPLDKRGALYALTVEDHYTRVRTAKGDHLVLMRLSDAMREVGDTEGAQVHRSHWVAWSAVTAAQRASDRAILTLADSTEIPVSRANVAKIKNAGLLPK